MIKYELAKKLKDAGFPQEMKDKSADDTYDPHMYSPYKGEQLFMPNLGQLIEACGEDLVDLRRDGEEWAAISNLTFEGRFDSDISLYGSGTNPEEAVANLWLALHETKE